MSIYGRPPESWIPQQPTTQAPTYAYDSVPSSEAFHPSEEWKPNKEDVEDRDNVPQTFPGEVEPEMDEFQDDEEDLWIQEPRQENWSELAVQSSSKKLWTTVFSEESAAGIRGQDSSTDQEASLISEKIEEVPEELEGISADSVRGCWEITEQESSYNVFGGQQQQQVPPTTGLKSQQLKSIAEDIYSTFEDTGAEESYNTVVEMDDPWFG
jgi:hypothetical protein